MSCYVPPVVRPFYMSPLLSFVRSFFSAFVIYLVRFFLYLFIWFVRSFFISVFRVCVCIPVVISLFVRMSVLAYFFISYVMSFVLPSVPSFGLYVFVYVLRFVVISLVCLVMSLFV